MGWRLRALPDGESNLIERGAGTTRRAQDDNGVARAAPTISE